MSISTRIDSILRQATQDQDVPGVVAMAASDKEVIYEGAFGKRAVGGDAAMTLDTVVWIASMSKAITATAAMQLIEQGKISLEQPAGEIVPQLKSPQVLDGFDSAGKPKLRPAKRPITVRHLLTHTSGFCYDIWNAPMGQYMAHASVPGIISCQNAALATPLVFDPGDRWEYGIGIDWAGKIVEAASGQKLGAYLEKNLLGPLGMKDTSFQITASKRSRLAPIHQRGDDGTLQATPIELPGEPEFEMGGGGLYGTARDYISFMQMILNRGKLNGVQVLRPETVDLMSQNHIGDLSPGELKTAAPPLSRDAAFWPDLPCKWGLSFLINTERSPEGRSAGSLAWAGLANTYYWIDPSRKVSGVFLTQILPFFDEKAIKLFKEFETAVYQSVS